MGEAEKLAQIDRANSTRQAAGTALNSASAMIPKPLRPRASKRPRHGRLVSTNYAPQKLPLISIWRRNRR